MLPIFSEVRTKDKNQRHKERTKRTKKDKKGQNKQSIQQAIADKLSRTEQEDVKNNSCHECTTRMN
jgi:ribosomal protein L14E/L6E/L27E